jgi:hypothetical protein
MLMDVLLSCVKELQDTSCGAVGYPQIRVSSPHPIAEGNPLRNDRKFFTPEHMGNGLPICEGHHTTSP